MTTSNDFFSVHEMISASTSATTPNRIMESKLLKSYS
jgi:hypothetical protein